MPVSSEMLLSVPLCPSAKRNEKCELNELPMRPRREDDYSLETSLIGRVQSAANGKNVTRHKARS